MTLRMPDSGLSLVVSGIGKVIRATDVRSCVIQALFAIIEVLRHDKGDTLIRKSKHDTSRSIITNASRPTSSLRDFLDIDRH